MFSFLPIIASMMGLTFVALQTSHADLGETREQLVTCYGQPTSESKDTLRFTAKGVPGIVVLGPDGKSVEEGYGYTRDIGQNRIMEILLRNSKGLPWRALKLDDSGGPYTQITWRYRQSETNLHASYERDDAAHDAVYYGLTISRDGR